MLFREAFHEAKLVCPKIDLPNGQETIDYLSGSGPFTDRGLYPMPSLVLLDLDMPVVDGFGVLAWRQTRPELQALPIVVLSSSDLTEDMEKARRLGANDYLVKPMRQSELVRVVLELQQRWLCGVPGGPGAGNTAKDRMWRGP